ncbi:MAG: bifunctional diaminohydroxyphosphoribosylaminopyrimidine deaminase/5-amino-6-(5-phosphoribosylamino)uracil reductase RibD [Actinomycetales bacterium]|nr:bifunctional diaminohydroxyphosphoribosylaminopyrimidine deaminase/5-amino-6-(5-phosphoribosylamino)uracil reductase RibD [Actinomycetales bacterium]
MTGRVSRIPGVDDDGHGMISDTSGTTATEGELLETAMRRALDLAARGPVTGGNPQVGCVLLDPDGRVVAEGWHHGAGTPHAEVEALTAARAAGVDPRGLTAVVTLEPCNHTGRTGPCSVALLEAGVARVAYAVEDPGAVSGHGADRLRAGGVEVVPHVLAAEAEEFLHLWLTAVRRGRPWVTVKWAQSLDGRAAAADGTSQWITGAAARQRVHEERAASDAILTGTGTVLADDPSLTARGEGGELAPHQPIPVVVGERAIPVDAALRRHPAGLIETGTRDLDAVLGDLNDRGLRRVYVEAGPALVSALIAGGHADAFSVYVAPMLLGGLDPSRLSIGELGVGTIAEARRLELDAVERLGDDLHLLLHPRAECPRPSGSED